MQPMSSGMIVDSAVHVRVLEEKLSASVMRSVMLEAAVQQLTLENTQHMMEIERLESLIPKDTEVTEDASAN